MDVAKPSIPPNMDLMLFRAREFVRSCSDEERKLLATLLDPSARPYSLRLIEYFFISYVKLKNLDDLQIEEIYEKYRRVLSSYCKETFDCFARGDTKYPIEINGVTYMSTPAQLNFLRWFVINNVHQVITDHLPDITERMKAERLKQRKKTLLRHAQLATVTLENAGNIQAVEEDDVDGDDNDL